MKKEKLCIKCGKPIIDRHYTAKQCWQCYRDKHYVKEEIKKTSEGKQ